MLCGFGVTCKSGGDSDRTTYVGIPVGTLATPVYIMIAVMSTMPLMYTI